MTVCVPSSHTTFDETSFLFRLFFTFAQPLLWIVVMFHSYAEYLDHTKNPKCCHVKINFNLGHVVSVPYGVKMRKELDCSLSSYCGRDTPCCPTPFSSAQVPNARRLRRTNEAKPGAHSRHFESIKAKHFIDKAEKATGFPTIYCHHLGHRN